MSRRDRLRAQREATIRDRSRQSALVPARPVRRRSARPCTGARSSDAGDAPLARLPGRDVRLCRLGQDPRPGLPPGDRSRLDRRPARQLRPGLTDRAVGPTLRAAIPRGDRASHRGRRDRHRTRRTERPAVPSRRRRWIGLVRPLLADCILGDQAVLLRARPAVRARVADPGARGHRRSLHHRDVAGPGVRRRCARRAGLTRTPARPEGRVPRPCRRGAGRSGRHGGSVRPRAPAVGRRRHDAPDASAAADAPTDAPTDTPSPSAAATAAAGTPGASVAPSPVATPAPPSGPVVAHVSQLASGRAVSFDDPNTGDPGVVIRLRDGKFVAYDTVCTHAGCTVGYDRSSGYLICPCHGAAFDPANAAAVIAGPADQPLASLPIHVDPASGRITLTG